MWLGLVPTCGLGFELPHVSRLHWKSTFLRCVLSMAKVGAQDGKSHLTCVFQIWAHNSSTNLPLAKANHLAHSKVKGQESTPLYQEVM